MSARKGSTEDLERFDALTEAVRVQAVRMMWVHIELAIGTGLQIVAFAAAVWMRVSVHEYSNVLTGIAWIGVCVIWHGTYRLTRVRKVLREREHALLEWLRMRGVIASALPTWMMLR